jgi:hypothetical protein
MRGCLLLIVAAALVLHAAEPKTETIEGRLSIQPGAPATLVTADHRTIELDGDKPTRLVLHDTRIDGMHVHATGHFTAVGRFLIDPQHKRALTVHKDDGEKMITYWCDVCGIRSYTPGPCVCCQAETELDLRPIDDIR